MHLTERAEPALLALLSSLDVAGYNFVPVTPATHARVVQRADRAEARNLRDIFGWSLPFPPDLLPPRLLDLLEQADLLERQDGLLKSRVRVGSICNRLIIHSAFPTEQEDAVFFSPDTLRFVSFVRDELVRLPGVKRLVDIGSGPGGGALAVAALVPGARLTLCDINETALRLARINARHAGLDIETVAGGLEAVQGMFDAAIANPPFMVDEDGRTYRDGGDMHGARLSLDWAIEAAERLSPGGRLLLYTGAAIVDGRDELRSALDVEMRRRDCGLRYWEIDPDIYGEELEKPAYAAVDRIAAVAAVVEKSG